MVDDVFDANNYIHDFSEVSDADWETPLWDEKQMKDAIEKGIRCGIQEFVKSLWHDASEEPDRKSSCIGRYKCFSDFVTFRYPIGSSSWKDYVRYSTLHKWCYLSDLLPKEGGEK